MIGYMPPGIGAPVFYEHGRPVVPQPYIAPDASGATKQRHHTKRGPGRMPYNRRGKR